MPELPPLPTQAMHYAQHLFRKAEAFARGKPMQLPAHLIEERLTICASCPHRENDKCSLCGCPLEEKAVYPFQYCDDGRWPEQTEQEIKK